MLTCNWYLAVGIVRLHEVRLCPRSRPGGSNGPKYGSIGSAVPGWAFSFRMWADESHSLESVIGRECLLGNGGLCSQWLPLQRLWWIWWSHRPCVSHPLNPLLTQVTTHHKGPQLLSPSWAYSCWPLSSVKRPSRAPEHKETKGFEHLAPLFIDHWVQMPIPRNRHVAPCKDVKRSSTRLRATFPRCCAHRSLVDDLFQYATLKVQALELGLAEEKTLRLCQGTVFFGQSGVVASLLHANRHDFEAECALFGFYRSSSQGIAPCWSPANKIK